MKIILIAALLLGAGWLNQAAAQNAPPAAAPARERLLMDSGWRFALGNANDPAKDFDPGSSYFSYLAKAGNGAGAAAAGFDDRSWRVVNLPHDWAVELPFSDRGSSSHGFKALGRNFPENSVGWYRKSFSIPASDPGKHITVEFDGAFRDSQVWVNGFYLGREASGYTSFGYDLTDYLNYGGNNTIAVRVDASLEEGWFYEGAGIYRNVWLVKTAPLHVAQWGTFVTTDVKGDSADVTARVTVNNDAPKEADFQIEQTILDADGKAVVGGDLKDLSLPPGASGDFSNILTVPHPQLWSLESPYLHTLVTTIRRGDAVVDRYETPFGIRTIRWDPNDGFFLNGQRVELKGTCDHQDAGGVGVAVPEALDYFRIKQLKKMGSNAIRTSHNAPAPELLDACDRLGMLVIDENRETGINPQELDELQALIRRDRNHPSVIVWSLGNEEWKLEGNPKGARVTQTMQTFAHYLDPTRPCTVAISGGWGGSSTVIDVAGYNYIKQSNSDRQHARFPNQSGVGTEETPTQGTRGVYFDDRARCYLAPVENGSSGGNCEVGWKYYAARPYLAGLFYWTGFDYRGEETPFGWPAISSQFGILDTCGFPKDDFYYLKAWWTDELVLHVFPHWNWPGKEGQDIDVRVFSNCQEVELFLNGQNLGRKTMPRNSHLEWQVRYEPGTLLARGYHDGKEVLTDKVETTGAPATVCLTPDRATFSADGEDVSVITVQVNDAQGRLVPTAANEITFQLAGPGRIIGVGNGDPSSHEPDVFVIKWPSRLQAVTDWKWSRISDPRQEGLPEVAANFNDLAWQNDDVHSDSGPLNGAENGVFRGHFTVSEQDLASETVKLSFGRIDDEGWVYVNGQKAGESHDWQAAPAFDVKRLLHPGTNIVAVAVANRSSSGGVNFGVTLQLQDKLVVPDWKRSLFNGLAQVIVQSTGQPGEITLTARSPGVTESVLKLHAQPAPRRPAVAAN